MECKASQLGVCHNVFFLACQFCFPSPLPTSVRLCRQLPLSLALASSRALASTCDISLAMRDFGNPCQLHC